MHYHHDKPINLLVGAGTRYEEQSRRETNMLGEKFRAKVIPKLIVFAILVVDRIFWSFKKEGKVWEQRVL